MNVSNVDFRQVYRDYTTLYQESSKIQDQLRLLDSHISSLHQQYYKETQPRFGAMLSSWWGRLIRWSRTENVDLESFDDEAQKKVQIKAQEIFDEEGKKNPQIIFDVYDVLGRIMMLKDVEKERRNRFEEIDRLKRNLPIDVNKSENTFNLIKSICGGPQDFDNLLQLELGDRQSLTGSIDFIASEEMISSVMRFTDKFGRQGIAVLMIRDGTEIPQVQTFFQRDLNSCEWHDGGAKCIPVDGALIDGGIVKIAALKALRRLIKKGECVVESADGRGNKHTYRLYGKILKRAEPVTIPNREYDTDMSGSPTTGSTTGLTSRLSSSPVGSPLFVTPEDMEK